MTPSGESITAERLHIAGPIRWAFTDQGRVIVQFASREDAIMALRLLDRGLELVTRHLDGNQLEYRLTDLDRSDSDV